MDSSFFLFLIVISLRFSQCHWKNSMNSSKAKRIVWSFVHSFFGEIVRPFLNQILSELAIFEVCIMLTKLLSVKWCSVVFKIIEHGTHGLYSVMEGIGDSHLNKRVILCENPRLLFKREKRQSHLPTGLAIPVWTLPWQRRC
jgi:hypothetical protein